VSTAHRGTKWEAASFSRGFPEVYFHLRPPVLQPPPETRQECIIFFELARAMGLDYRSVPPFAALEAAVDAGDPAPVLTLIRGLSAMFAMHRQQELRQAGTISAEGNPAAQVRPGPGAESAGVTGRSGLVFD